MAGPEVSAKWVAADEDGRAELTRELLDFDSSDAQVRETAGERFVVLTFPDGTEDETALAQASEIVRGAAERAGVAQESIELTVGDESR